jgi:hypothetical protein
VRRPITLTRGAAAAILALVLCGGFPLVQNLRWWAAPTLTCDDVPSGLLETLVPQSSPVAETSNDGWERQVVCVWESEPEAAHSAQLRVEISQYDDQLLRPGAREARGAYSSYKDVYVHQDALSVIDLPGLGEDAYYDAYTNALDRGEARVASLAGNTVIEVSYMASPSTPTLRLAAAAGMVRALLEELR